MSSKNIITLTLILLNKAIGIFRSFVRINGLDPGQNISKRIRINFLPIVNEYIFLSFRREVCQNKNLLDLSLSKSRALGEDPLWNASLPFWNVGKVLSCSEIWYLLQVDDLQPSCLLRTNCSEIPQILISPVELRLSSTFSLFLNLFVTFPYGSPLLNGEDHTEMEVERKEFWNYAQWTKYSHLELTFPNFLPASGAGLVLTWKKFLTKGCTFDPSTSRSCRVLR